jgi:hypothetical protein
MHLAIPTLFGMVLFASWRPAGLVAFAYVAVILAGSIYLGWHYAIDGYVSIISVGLLWKVAGVMCASAKNGDRVVLRADASLRR